MKLSSLRPQLSGKPSGNKLSGQPSGNKLSGNRPSSNRPSEDVEPAPAVASVRVGTGADAGNRAPKGRPTPKRRDSDPRSGPVAPPKTRREALARQRQQLKAPKRAGGGPLTPAEKRQRMLAGDDGFLPKRDLGPFRRLARDYVDSHRMLSNILLILFPLSFAPLLIKSLHVLNILVVVLLLAVLAEWVLTGRRLKSMAVARGLDTGKDSALSIGAYAGMRAYLPRRWRVPKARVGLGDEI